MTGKNRSGAAWHHTTVALRADIHRQALERGIDISDACNRALASLTGSEYAPEKQDVVPVPPPVIIAKNGSSPGVPGEADRAPSRKLHPVINADDPAAPAKVVQAKTPLKKVPAEPPVPVPAPVPEAGHAPPSVEEPPFAAPAAPEKKAAAQKEKPAPSKKKAKGDALKLFFSSKIARTDDPGAAVSKDEVYELFARFCREHRVTPVPERKTVTVALKNQFALTEKMVSGTPNWTGIRLK